MRRWNALLAVSVAVPSGVAAQDTLAIPERPPVLATLTLAEALGHTDDGIVYEAAWALAALRRHAAPAAPELAEVLGHRSLAMAYRYSHLADRDKAELLARVTGSMLS